MKQENSEIGKKVLTDGLDQGISLKVKELSNDITFHSIHNQLWMPQYKVNVQSTWNI